MNQQAQADASLPLRTWLTIWSALRWYHRYTVDGLETIIDSPPALIVGYHGRPMAFDMCILTVELYNRLGYLPHGVTNSSVDAIAPLKWLSDGLGFFSGDSKEIDTVVARGEHLILTPGAALEGSRSFRERYKVNWGHHVGYLRLALRHGLNIIPVATAGCDDAYIGLNDGYALGRRLGLPRGWALWFGVGPLGFFPFSPPFPVRFHQVIGNPIDLNAGGRVDPDDRKTLLRLHKKVTSTVQKLLGQALTRRREVGRQG